MEELFEFVKSYTGISIPLQIKIYKTIITAFVIWVISRISIGLVHKWIDDLKKQYRLRKIIKRVSFIIFILLVADLWLVKFDSLATFFGLVSAGLAIALKDPITDLAGWLFIIWRKPFELSDRVEVGEHKGDVIDIRLFQFTLIEIGNWVGADQSTGRVIHIPNASVFSHKLANYTTGFQYIWDEISVLVTFESDWEKAKAIIHEVTTYHTAKDVEHAQREIKHAAKKYLIFYKNLSPKVYTSVEESGVLLSARYLVISKERRYMAEQIWEDILRKFKQNDDIDFAYPSIRYYDNRTEGKKPLRAD
ncbi:mechanosensitive channel MscS [Salinivirga cyanobacteriivorans]|uniref:Mechanosensitive channel MscS n=1 Tax=Salinivirga cyanobacteriivorans TaxID=1307839 RepID=A0A0S2HXA9_9BACT|nr:mechanosensitive ion channel domain-containing protein [Salinivirga cyanobacteriivorans]ALO14671.1 mechanosensitive channel MscS [Salinivirga cyanobacteriivorans]